MIRLLIVGVVFAILGAMVVAKPRAGILTTFAFLAVLGDFRRLIGANVGFVKIDTILLVEPVIALLLFVIAFASGHLNLGTPLTKWIAALTALMFLQIFNPAQGSLMVGVFGAFFFIVPMLWFWIGDAFGSPKMIERVSFGVVVPLAVPAALLGIYQAYFGLLPFEHAWVVAKGYAALSIGADAYRAIGFFTSSAEYAHYLSLAMILIWAAWLSGRRTLIFIWPLLALALFLETSRGPIVTSLFAMAALWAIQGRSRAVWLPRMAVAGAIGVAGLAFMLTHIHYSALGEQAEVLVTHQAEGLLNPGDSKVSTAGMHIGMMMNGLMSGFTHPFGFGLGFSSLAATRGDVAGGSTEVDLSNMMIALGILGGVIYVGVIITALWAALTYWRRQRNYAGLAVLGCLLVMAGSWLNGGEYSVAALIWFLIGSLNRCSREPRRAAAAPRARYA